MLLALGLLGGGRARVGARALRLGAAGAAGPAEAGDRGVRGLGPLPLRGGLRRGRAPLRPRAAPDAPRRPRVRTGLGHGVHVDRRHPRRRAGVPRRPLPRARHGRALAGQEPAARADRRRRRAPRLAHPDGHAPRPALPVQPAELRLRPDADPLLDVRRGVGRVHAAGHRRLHAGGRRALRRRQSGRVAVDPRRRGRPDRPRLARAPLARRGGARPPGSSSPRTAEPAGP